VTTAVDGKLFSSLSANSSQFALKGGHYVLAVVGGTITSGSVDLQMLGPDGSTFVSLPGPVKITAAGSSAGGYAPPGQYRLTLTSA
jgi:hypothetical protein